MSTLLGYLFLIVVIGIVGFILSREIPKARARKHFHRHHSPKLHDSRTIVSYAGLSHQRRDGLDRLYDY